jgi:hypothetical protein
MAFEQLDQFALEHLYGVRSWRWPVPSCGSTTWGDAGRRNRFDKAAKDEVEVEDLAAEGQSLWTARVNPKTGSAAAWTWGWTSAGSTSSTATAA